MRWSFLLILGLFMALPNFPLLKAEQRSVEVELTDGSVLKGTLISQTATELLVQTALGASRIPSDKLSEKSRSEFGFNQTASQTGLKQRVAELEQLVEQLRAENQSLRKLIAAKGSASGYMAPTSPPKESEIVTTPATENATGYWISSTGKRHNSRCRYYQTSKGRPGSASEGVACKICGG